MLTGGHISVNSSLGESFAICLLSYVYILLTVILERGQVINFDSNYVFKEVFTGEVRNLRTQLLKCCWLQLKIGILSVLMPIPFFITLLWNNMFYNSTPKYNSNSKCHLKLPTLIPVLQNSYFF